MTESKRDYNTPDDQSLGAYCYCRSHVGPHETGWCTVPVYDKLPLKATTHAEAVAECRALNWKVYPDIHVGFVPDPISEPS